MIGFQKGWASQMSDNSQRSGKVILLGFDGMDFDLTSTLIEQGKLPNLEKLSRKGVFAPLLSVFPADSIPSWITTFTGKDPSDHGILDHVNYLLGDQDEAKIDTSVFHQKTFWDEIGSKSGSRVCIINPFMAYPAWPVNGVMVSGPAFIAGDIQVSDETSIGDLKIPDSIGGLEDLPGKATMRPFLDKAMQDTRDEAAFGLGMLEKNQPDLFFQTFLASDRVQHFLWRYCDAEDPTYPGQSDVDQGIEEYFSVADKVIGDFMERLDENDILLVMSDHGHGMRCTHCFNFNEYFRRQGYLKSTSGGRRISSKVVIEKLKNRVLRFMNDHDLEDYISKIAKLVPNAQALKKGTHIANYSDSQAYAPDFAGTNPFGGVCINRDKVDDYEAFRTQLIDELERVTYQGQPVFRWIKPRESMYCGQHIDSYPDLLYEMIPSLGTGFSMHTDLFTINPTHKKISGGHKKYGIFFGAGPGQWDVVTSDCKITNMYKTLLTLFGVDDDNSRTVSFFHRKSPAESPTN